MTWAAEINEMPNIMILNQILIQRAIFCQDKIAHLYIFLYCIFNNETILCEIC